MFGMERQQNGVNFSMKEDFSLDRQATERFKKDLVNLKRNSKLTVVAQPLKFKQERQSAPTSPLPQLNDYSEDNPRLVSLLKEFVEKTNSKYKQSAGALKMVDV